MNKIDGYEVLVKLETSTREIYLVRRDETLYVMKTMTLDHAATIKDTYRLLDVQDQIDREVYRWEKCKDLGILNPIIQHGRDSLKCSTDYIIVPYVKTILSNCDKLCEMYEEKIYELASKLYNKLQETELWLDEITFEEITKPSSWGLRDDGSLVLIDYGV